MEENISRQFFLGANTGAGFVSLYPEFTDPDRGAFFWYIKGGPGNGKSTLMRRAAECAESAGLTVETVLCSGDPDSLDGIYIPEKKLGYVDATSPHVQEPAVPGASGKYLDLSAFYRPIPPETAAELAAFSLRTGGSTCVLTTCCTQPCSSRPAACRASSRRK